MRVALTGGIGSGKTAVSDRLAELGAVIIDADLLAREVVEPGTPGLAAIVDRFGSGVLDGERLDRPALGRIVFGDDSARRDLEAIVHPAVRQRSEEIEAKAGEQAIVVHVIPLLLESGRVSDFSVVLVVDTELEEQLRRIQQRDGLDEQAAMARIKAQADREERLAAATFVIRNRGTLEALRAETDRVWAELVALADQSER